MTDEDKCCITTAYEKLVLKYLYTCVIVNEDSLERQPGMICFYSPPIPKT